MVIDPVANLATQQTCGNGLMPSLNGWNACASALPNEKKHHPKRHRANERERHKERWLHDRVFRQASREKWRRYRQKSTHTCAMAYRKWAQDNPERVRARNRRWAARHREKTREKAKAWRLANPDGAKALWREGSATTSPSSGTQAGTWQFILGEVERHLALQRRTKAPRIQQLSRAALPGTVQLATMFFCAERSLCALRPDARGGMPPVRESACVAKAGGG